MQPFAPSRIVVVGLFAGVVVGCATPAPIVRLEPRAPNGVVWVAGRAVQAKERAGVRVAAAFERQDGRALCVRLEIENRTGAPIEVSPDEVTFMSCPSVDNATCSGSWGVVDPEQVLAGLDEQESRSRAEAANTQGLYTSLVFLSAIGDIASMAGGRGSGGTGVETVALASQGEVAAGRADATLASVGNQREVWSDVAFRRNTLAPGHGTSGLVYLPDDPKTQYVWLHVRAGGQIFPFGFKQSARQVGVRPAAPPR